MKKPLVIGIAGGSASGKTSISQKIYETFQEIKSVQVIRQDDYYRNQDHLPFEERLKTNYDHPLAFDNDFLIVQVHELLNFRAVEKPIYDFAHHTRSTETEIVHPAEVIILEGLFVLEDKAVRNLLDIKIFVDTDADVRFIRRLMRDIKERDRSVDNVVTQYQNTVKRMHEQFVEPSKRYADVIVPHGSENSVAIDLIVTKISSILNVKNIIE
ncbi:MAG: uridine kinase [Erysipelothrix sp.]|nr:uridine kinase [Erysipelothrix sp.]